ncbi:DUF397 domain-containing protein [Cryptosporangium minutisporangium]|uniref:DUF397 domain-containing protein n=1 Tax=Cryptosporangium minutisporangium TaxID=113569 RepID=UPI0031EFED8A
MMRSPSGVVWRVAGACSHSTCVAVGLTSNDDLVRLADTKSPGGTVLGYPRSEWRAFLAGVKAGEFDRLS